MDSFSGDVGEAIIVVPPDIMVDTVNKKIYVRKTMFAPEDVVTVAFAGVWRSLGLGTLLSLAKAYVVIIKT